MNRSLRLIPTVAVSAIALAACGGHTSTHPSADSNNLATWRAAITCARHHGMPNIPDPVMGINGHVTIPGGTPTPTPVVASACARQIRAVDPTFGQQPAAPAPDMRALVAAADCMRAHGYPSWPDPNPQGVFHVKSAVAGSQARMSRAVYACRSLFPNGWSLDITPSGQ